MFKKFIFHAILFVSSALVFAQEKTDWIDLPFVEWPTIALINHVEYENGDRYVHSSFEYAGTSFLIDTGKDTLAVTAKHVLMVARNNNSNAIEINKHLKSWVMSTKPESKDSVIIDKLINEDPGSMLEGPDSKVFDEDMIVFSTLEVSNNIHALKPRFTRIKNQSKIYIVSNAYEENVTTLHTGIVHKSEENKLFLDMGDEEILGGISGSPVLDENGFLIGVISNLMKDELTGKSLTVAMSAQYLSKILERYHL